MSAPAALPAPPAIALDGDASGAGVAALRPALPPPAASGGAPSPGVKPFARHDARPPGQALYQQQIGEALARPAPPQPDPLHTQTYRYFQPPPASVPVLPFADQGYLLDQLVAVLVDGRAFFNHYGQSDWKPVGTRQVFIGGDAVRTGDNGYLALAFSTGNLLMLLPHTGLRFTISPPADGQPAKLQVYVHRGSVLLSSRTSTLVEVNGRHGVLRLSQGEASLTSNGEWDEVRALFGTCSYQPMGDVPAIPVAEGRMLHLAENGMDPPPTPFDTRLEYDRFRRFRTSLQNFDAANRIMSVQMDYRADTALLNGVFVSHMELDDHGFRIVDPGAGPAPREIHLRLKLTPYPRPDERFELYLDKDLVYALREGTDVPWSA